MRGEMRRTGEAENFVCVGPCVFKKEQGKNRGAQCFKQITSGQLRNVEVFKKSRAVGRLKNGIFCQAEFLRPLDQLVQSQCGLCFTTRISLTPTFQGCVMNSAGFKPPTPLAGLSDLALRCSLSGIYYWIPLPSADYLQWHLSFFFSILKSLTLRRVAKALLQNLRGRNLGICVPVFEINNSVKSLWKKEKDEKPKKQQQTNNPGGWWRCRMIPLTECRPLPN